MDRAGAQSLVSLKNFEVGGWGEGEGEGEEKGKWYKGLEVGVSHQGWEVELIPRAETGMW